MPGVSGVGSLRRRGEMPRAAVGVLVPLQEAGEHLVDLLALWQACALVDGRANQRMTELDARLPKPNQAGGLGGAERGSLDPQLARPSQHDGGIAGVVSSGDQKECLALRGKAARSLEEGGLERRPNRQGIGERRLPGELVLAQEVGELEQGERVAAGAGEQAISHFGREPDACALREQGARRLWPESGEPQLRQAGGLEAAPLALAGREDERDPFRLEPARRKRQGLGRWLVEPLGVVDGAEQRPPLGLRS